MLPSLIRYLAALVTVVAAMASLTACSFLTPYRIEIVQGNVVTKEMIAQIQPGLGRTQVRDILGSPLLTDIFHTNRWDYVFTIRRKGTEYQQRRVTIFFKDDKVERFEADELPSEREFVASIDSGKVGKVPPLELTPEQIKALPVPKSTTPTTTATTAPVGAVRDYPTLEPIAP